MKDASAKRHLIRYAQACNFVWNYCCEIQREAQRRSIAGLNARWPTAFELIKLCTGSSTDLNLQSRTVEAICRQFVASRDQHKRCPRFRASFGAKAALGWVPFNAEAVQLIGSAITYRKRKFVFWKTRDLQGEFKVGSFTQDARGRWYVSFKCEVPDDLPVGNGKVGIDLGLKTVATCSDGFRLDNQRLIARCADKLAVSQRAGNKKRARAIHAKIANARKHHLHVASTKLADANSLIVVGDVSPSKLKKTKMAKSVSDAGWAMFKEMLRYKTAMRRAAFIEVSERYSSQTCSRCGTIPDSSPKGMCALGIRRWTCLNCDADHDRDVNAAMNILRVGLERQALAGEISAIHGREDVKPPLLALACGLS